MEATKLSLRSGDDGEKDRAAAMLLRVLAESLRLLHPLLPFVTEEIYGKLPNVPEGELLISAPYPAYDASRSDQGAEEQFAFLQELVRQIRTLRSECTLPPERKIRALVRPQGERAAFLRENAPLVRLLAGLGDLEIAPAEAARPAGSIGLVGSGFEAFVFIGGAEDAAALRQKFSRDIEKDRKFIQGLQAKLANANFLNNAPPELVAGERLKLEEALRRTSKLESYIKDMQ